jgi:hypothetical protein
MALYRSAPKQAYGSGLDGHRLWIESRRALCRPLPSETGNPRLSRLIDPLLIVSGFAEHLILGGDKAIARALQVAKLPSVTHPESSIPLLASSITVINGFDRVFNGIGCPLILCCNGCNCFVPADVLIVKF